MFRPKVRRKLTPHTTNRMLETSRTTVAASRRIVLQYGCCRRRYNQLEYCQAEVDQGEHTAH